MSDKRKNIWIGCRKPLGASILGSLWLFLSSTVSINCVVFQQLTYYLFYKFINIQLCLFWFFPPCGFDNHCPQFPWIARSIFWKTALYFTFGLISQLLKISNSSLLFYKTLCLTFASSSLDFKKCTEYYIFVLICACVNNVISFSAHGELCSGYLYLSMIITQS